MAPPLLDEDVDVVLYSCDVGHANFITNFPEWKVKQTYLFQR